MTAAADHALSCAALSNWHADCNCGVGIEEITLSIRDLSVVAVSVSRLIRELGLAKSSSEASRLISSNAVEIVDGAGRRTADFSEWLPLEFLIRVGRNWRKVTLI